MNTTKEKFEEFVSDALDNLPEKFRKKLNNVAIFVEDVPTTEQKNKLRLRKDDMLLGLFEGFSQAKRLNFGPVLPDKITIFRRSILSHCNSEDDIEKQITKTLKHEVAHHFGLDEIGARKAAKIKS